MIFRFLSSEEKENLEDEGLSIFLSTKTVIQNILNAPLGEGERDFPGEMEEPGVKREESVKSEDPSEPYNSDDEVEEIPAASLQKLSKLFLKDFKVNGKIGKTEKDGISYTSLMYQIDNGLKKGHSKLSIIDGVVKSISHESHLRQYLEGKKDVTFSSLLKILRFHFKEKDATTLFTELSTSKQGNNESPQEFVLRLMNLRQKVLFVSQEESDPYGVSLVQKRFCHAISTGLKSDFIRGELREMLKHPATTHDEELLLKLTQVVAEENEHNEKFSTGKKPTTSVNELTIQEEKPEIKRKNVLLDEVRALRKDLDHLVSVSSVQGQRNPKSYNNNRKPGSGWNKCAQCNKDNIAYCNHCFNCGGTNHSYRYCRHVREGTPIGKFNRSEEKKKN